MLLPEEEIYLHTLPLTSKRKNITKIIAITQEVRKSIGYVCENLVENRILDDYKTSKYGGGILIDAFDDIQGPGWIHHSSLTLAHEGTK